MKNSQQLNGKTVGRVQQYRLTSPNHPARTCVDRIEFTDGSFIVFGAVESENGYGVECRYYPAKRRGAQ